MKKIWSLKDVFLFFLIVILGFGVLTLVFFLIEASPFIISIVLDSGLFIIVCSTLWYFLKKNKISLDDFGFNDVSFKFFLLSFVLGIAVLFIGSYLTMSLSKLVGLGIDSDLSLFKDIIGEINWSKIYIFKLTVGILLPLAEEILFRGVLFRFIRGRKPFLFAAISSSLIFAIAHFSLMGFITFFLLGFACAYIFEKSKSIFYSFMVHGILNYMTINLFVMNMMLNSS